MYREQNGSLKTIFNSTTAVTGGQTAVISYFALFFLFNYFKAFYFPDLPIYIYPITTAIITSKVSARATRHCLTANRGRLLCEFPYRAQAPTITTVYNIPTAVADWYAHCAIVFSRFSLLRRNKYNIGGTAPHVVWAAAVQCFAKINFVGCTYRGGTYLFFIFRARAICRKRLFGFTMSIIFSTRIKKKKP